MQIDYELKRTRRRTLELRLYPDRRVEVRAPLRATRAEIDAFVSSREAWLKSRLARLEQKPRISEEEKHSQGGRHWFLGEELVLELHPGKRHVHREGNRLLVTGSEPGRHEQVRDLIQRWYAEEARRDFTMRLARLWPTFEQRGHSRLPQLRIRSMRSRWGSLSTSGWMSLNMELIKTPPSCIDYVITHELCHLEHMNHGPGFKALMYELMPDWRERRQRLRRHPL